MIDYYRSKRFKEAAAHGFNVFPLREGTKVPNGPWKKFIDHSASPMEIEDWDNSKYNVGVICGAPSNIVVVDIDSDQAQAVYDSMRLDLTPCVKTAKGKHYYFRHPGSPVKNSVRLLETELDIRGDGGYVVAAGSIHESGHVYTWTISPDEVAFADFPRQFSEALERRNTRQGANSHDNASPIKGLPADLPVFLVSELKAAISAIKSATEGTRNDTLFKAGAGVASKVAATAYDWEPVREFLRDAALAAGLAADEVERTLASCWNAGRNTPDPLVSLAQDWVYISATDSFFHVKSSSGLAVKPFNNTYAHLLDKGTVAQQLWRNRIVATYQDTRFDPRTAARSILENGLTFFNTYLGSPIQPEEGDVTPFLDFVSYLVPDQSERNHLLNMMASMVQQPGTKIRHALLMRSKHQGVGKSMLMDIWAALVGPKYARKSTPDELAGPFQGFIENSLLVIVEELNLGAGARDYNKIKEFISNDVVSVNEKYRAAKNCRNYATFVMLTNLETPLIIEPSDRRIFFIDCMVKPKDSKYYYELTEWWTKNLNAIAHFMFQRDLTGFSAGKAPPMTAAKLALIAESKTPLAQAIKMEIDEADGPLANDLLTLSDIQQELRKNGLITQKPALVKALNEIGAVALGQQRLPNRHKGSRVSLWALRNVEHWQNASPQQLADEYNPCHFYRGVPSAENDNEYSETLPRHQID